VDQEHLLLVLRYFTGLLVRAKAKEHCRREDKHAVAQLMACLHYQRKKFHDLPSPGRWCEAKNKIQCQFMANMARAQGSLIEAEYGPFHRTGQRKCNKCGEKLEEEEDVCSCCRNDAELREAVRKAQLEEVSI